MKTVTIDLQGERYALCFSVRVLNNLIEKYGSEEKANNALANLSFVDSIFLLHQMMLAGEKEAKKNGVPNGNVPSWDDFLDNTTPFDLENITNSITDAISQGLERKVEVETPKK